jgi:IS4 transposase
MGLTEYECALILFDLGFYDFWLFDRIDTNDSWLVSRVKSNANPEIVEEVRTWRGNSITLEGKSLKPSSTTFSDRK